MVRFTLLFAAHAGCNGHKIKTATLENCREHFAWNNLKSDVEFFVDSCIHCLAMESRERISRPLGRGALHGRKPEEVIHFHSCSTYKGEQGQKYVVMIKDDLSSYIRLYPWQ